MAKKLKSEADKILAESELTERNKIFCREYIFDWNATRSYKTVYPNIKDDDSAAAASSRLLSNVKIQEYIELIQKDLEKLAGISRMKVISEHMKMAFSSIAHLHNTWIERKEFESLTEDQRSCIAEIDTKIKTEYEYNADSEKREPIRVEYVRIKLYDKQKALDSISKMLGYDAPIKTEVDIKSLSLPEITITTKNA